MYITCLVDVLVRGILAKVYRQHDLDGPKGRLHDQNVSPPIMPSFYVTSEKWNHLEKPRCFHDAYHPLEIGKPRLSCHSTAHY